MEIFEYSNYRKLLADLVERPERGGGRGAQTRLANHLNCQQAFVSRIISDKAELSADQAILTAGFFQLSALEREYWLNLVFENRAGVQALKKYYQEKLKAIREEKKSLSKSIQTGARISEVEKTHYYTDWYYQAIHMMCGLKGSHTIKNLSSRLGISETVTARVVDHLVQAGLVLQKDGQYRIGEGHIHLAAEDPLVWRQHSNWRLQTIQRFSRPAPNDLHYTSIVTCSRKDVEKIKAIMAKAVTEIREVVRQSEDEVVFHYSLDAYEI